MLKNRYHNLLGILCRSLICALITGFILSTTSVNLTGVFFLQDDSHSLENVIRNLKHFSQVQNAEEASLRMRAMIVALQSASGLMMVKKTETNDRQEKLVVTIKLSFLISEPSGLQGPAYNKHLNSLDWKNNYHSISITPPAPPPLLFS